MKKIYFKPNLQDRRSLSAVIATILLILLVMVTVSVVWVTVRNLVSDKTEGVKSCFDVSFSEMVTLNNDYTCFNSTSNETRFSINVGEVDIESIKVSISSLGNSKTYTLTSDEQIIDGLLNYPSKTTNIKMPSKGSGQTYIATGFYETPDWIKIAPIVDGKQCEISDTINTPEDCSFFVR